MKTINFFLSIFVSMIGHTIIFRTNGSFFDYYLGAFIVFIIFFISFFSASDE